MRSPRRSVRSSPLTGNEQRFLSSLPPGYVEETHPGDAADDWLGIWRLLSPVLDPETRLAHLGGSIWPSGPASSVARSACWRSAPACGGASGRFSLAPPRPAPGHSSCHRCWRSWGGPSASPRRRRPSPGTSCSAPDGPEAYVDDIGLRVTTPTIGPSAPGRAMPIRLVAAIEAVLAGRAELNILNRLVVGAGSWAGEEVNLLCAYCSFRQVVGGPRAADRAEVSAGVLWSPFRHRRCGGRTFPSPPAPTTRSDPASSQAGVARRRPAGTTHGAPRRPPPEKVRPTKSPLTPRSRFPVRRSPICPTTTLCERSCRSYQRRRAATGPMTGAPSPLQVRQPGVASSYRHLGPRRRCSSGRPISRACTCVLERVAGGGLLERPAL